MCPVILDYYISGTALVGSLMFAKPVDRVPATDESGIFGAMHWSVTLVIFTVSSLARSTCPDLLWPDPVATRTTILFDYRWL